MSKFLNTIFIFEQAIQKFDKIHGVPFKIAKLTPTYAITENFDISILTFFLNIFFPISYDAVSGESPYIK